MADTRLDDPVLTEMVTRLRAVFEPERIYLFGSHARGDAKPESDYDLLMVLPSSPLPAIDASRSPSARWPGWEFPKTSLC